MNNGYQKSNGCGADKEGGKIFNTFFYPELQSKHVRPLATNAWMDDKLKDGWMYGETKDPEAKTHPCLVPFKELPIFQQKKDALFCAIVDALK